MDVKNLKTASIYINNLLLARGLLRNGSPIDFASHSSADGEIKHASTTAAEVINLVHDLILRRDRDQEQQESVAQLLKSLGAESQSLSLEVERLSSAKQNLRRDLALQQATIRAAQSASQSAESASRTLKEELTKAKTALSQAKTLCANDIRKRDAQIERLKGHLSGQQRGTNKGIIGATCVIAPTLGQIADRTSNREEQSPRSIEDAEYSLRQESTEFLTQLSQGLSDENDALIGLVHEAISTVKELLGSSDVQSVEPGLQGAEVTVIATSHEMLSKNLSVILQQLRDLLTNPSFAPIEEVHLRDEEIVRLRDGWDDMAARWKEAVILMKGWMSRMQGGDRTINIDELRRGLGLSEGFENIHHRNLTYLPLNMRNAVSEQRRPIEQEPFNDLEAPGTEVKGASSRRAQGSYISISTSPASSPSASSPTAKNYRRIPRAILLASRDDQPRQHAVAASSARTNRPKKVPVASPARSRVALSPRSGNTMRGQKKPYAVGGPLEDGVQAPCSFLPEFQDEPQMTVRQKLDFAASEATRLSTSPSSSLQPTCSKGEGDDGPLYDSENITAQVNGPPARDSPVKKSHVRGRPAKAKRKRKSTLTPHELEELLMRGAKRIAE